MSKLHRKASQVFPETDFDLHARLILDAWGVDVWSDVDRTFQAVGAEPWDAGAKRTSLVSSSVYLSRSFATLADIHARGMTALLDGLGASGSLDRLIDELLLDYLTLGGFHRAGHHCFRLWPDLCHALLDTEFQAPSDLVRLPFRSIYLQFPREMMGRIRVDNEDGSVHPAVGAYMTECLNPQGRMQINVRVTSRPPMLTDDAPVSSNYHSWKVPVAESPVLDEALLRRANCGNEDSPLRAKGEGLRLAMNALLYITSAQSDLRVTESERERLARDFSHNPNPKTAEKRAGRARAMAAASWTRMVDAGSRLVIPNVPCASAGGGASRAALDHRITVRGHWRNQACGVGRQDHRLRWIAPHYRGPEMSEVVAGRTYEVVPRPAPPVSSAP